MISLVPKSILYLPAMLVIGNFLSAVTACLRIWRVENGGYFVVTGAIHPFIAELRIK